MKSSTQSMSQGQDTVDLDQLLANLDVNVNSSDETIVEINNNESMIPDLSPWDLTVDTGSETVQIPVDPTFTLEQVKMGVCL
jgi:hypothetical protein